MLLAGRVRLEALLDRQRPLHPPIGFGWAGGRSGAVPFGGRASTNDGVDDVTGWTTRRGGRRDRVGSGTGWTAGRSGPIPSPPDHRLSLDLSGFVLLRGSSSTNSSSPRSKRAPPMRTASAARRVLQRPAPTGTRLGPRSLPRSSRSSRSSAGSLRRIASPARSLGSERGRRPRPGRISDRSRDRSLRGGTFSREAPTGTVPSGGPRGGRRRRQAASQMRSCSTPSGCAARRNREPRTHRRALLRRSDTPAMLNPLGRENRFFRARPLVVGGEPQFKIIGIVHGS